MSDITTDTTDPTIPADPAVPPAHDPVLEEMIRDNIQDEKTARDVLDAQKAFTKVVSDNSERNASNSSAERILNAFRHKELIDALKEGPKNTRRDIAAQWLGQLASTTTSVNARKLVTERMAILDALYPETAA